MYGIGIGIGLLSLLLLLMLFLVVICVGCDGGNYCEVLVILVFVAGCLCMVGVVILVV